MIRLLDMYCGVGGAAVGYHRAGHEVVGVDIADQPDYPFAFHQGDAIAFLREHGHEFDAIHASPPCLTHSQLTKGNRSRVGWVDTHTDLIPATRAALHDWGGLWVMENVRSAPLRRDLTLCGLSFGLRVFRHRDFELGGWLALSPGHIPHRGHRVAGWRHGVRYAGDMFAVYGEGGDKGTVAEWRAAMGIAWTDNRAGIAQAIPPAYTEYIGAQLMTHLGEVAA